MPAPTAASATIAVRWMLILPPFEIISIYEYIDEQMKKGTATIQRTVDLDAAVSDSCFGYEFGQDYLDTVDRLAAAADFRISRLRHNKENNAC